MLLSSKSENTTVKATFFLIGLLATPSLTVHKLSTQGCRNRPDRPDRPELDLASIFQTKKSRGYLNSNHFKGLIGKNLFPGQYPSETHFLPFKFKSALKAVLA